MDKKVEGVLGIYTLTTPMYVILNETQYKMSPSKPECWFLGGEGLTWRLRGELELTVDDPAIFTPLPQAKTPSRAVRYYILNKPFPAPIRFVSGMLFYQMWRNQAKGLIETGFWSGKGWRIFTMDNSRLDAWGEFFTFIPEMYV